MALEYIRGLAVKKPWIKTVRYGDITFPPRHLKVGTKISGKVKILLCSVSYCRYDFIIASYVGPGLGSEIFAYSLVKIEGAWELRKLEDLKDFRGIILEPQTDVWKVLELAKERGVGVVLPPVYRITLEGRGDERTIDFEVGEEGDYVCGLRCRGGCYESSDEIYVEVYIEGAAEEVGETPTRLHR
ncbi:hypothetical protein IG193_00465 [Infirmifilum lucidum]|uniref:Uncharacterized protein n=1 Tax=Infirmifilum lucidum TaxID=2776706 RepID=A0A7L9FJ78_9CREN|nr:hypothetical protein [Infirmifilum lucidum]QOJ78974.1 hypothetical protein IG193_00465 [Infirmifilum lucidum]